MRRLILVICGLASLTMGIILAAPIPLPRRELLKMRKVIVVISFIALGLVAGFMAAPSTRAQDAEVQVTIFHDTHFHGNLQGPDGISLAHYMGLIQKLRSDTPPPAHSFFVGNGDDIGTSLMSGVFRGEHIIEALNAAGIDVDTFGNHEFDLGPARLRELIAMSKFPWVSANVRDAQTGGMFGAEVGARPWVTKELGGVKFGFTGLAPKETSTVSSPGPRVLFLDPVVAMNEVVSRMRAEGVQVVVLLSHLGAEETEKVVSQVKGIDIAVGDHESGVLAQPKVVNGAIVSRRGDELRRLGQLDLVISGGKIVRHTYVEHRIASTGPVSPEVKTVVDKYVSKLDGELNVEIGMTSAPLDTRRAAVRGGEAAAGNLIADALRGWANSDVAIQNGGSIRGDRTIEPGTLTRRHIAEMLPFPNYAMVLKVKGAQLWAALENGLSVEKGSGRFPQVSGLKLTYDPKAPAGSRLQQVWVGTSPLDRSAVYTLATNDFIAGGGDDYAALKEAQVIIPAAGGPLLTNLVMDYIKAQGTITPMVEGRMTLAGGQAPATEAPAALPSAGSEAPLAIPATLFAGLVLLAAGLRLRHGKA